MAKTYASTSHQKIYKYLLRAAYGKLRTKTNNNHEDQIMSLSL